MENDVVKAAKPVIDYLLGFRYRLAAGENIDLHTLRAEIQNHLRKMVATLQSIPSMQARINTIHYVMTGFADEVILSSSWNHAREWHDRLLEIEEFKTSVVGEKFFDLLENEGYRDPELAELFFTCLALGFRGRYRNQEEKLSLIKGRAYAALPQRLPDNERHLTPGAEYIIGGGKKHLPQVFGFSAIGVVLLVSIVIYFIASQWMWSDIADIINDVSRSLVPK